MDPTTGRFTGVDPFGGNIFEASTLHRYVYADASPLNRIDATGKFSTVTIAVAGLVAAIASIAIFSGAFNATFAGGTPTFINTDPVIVKGSGWTPTEVTLAIAGAAEIWAQQANIIVNEGLIREVQSRPLLEMPGSATNGDLIALAPSGRKHITIFNRRIGFNLRGGATTGVVGNRAIAVIPRGIDDAVRVAHEWGHLFGLTDRILPPSLMTGLGRPARLSPGERGRAREYVGRNYP